MSKYSIRMVTERGNENVKTTYESIEDARKRACKILPLKMSAFAKIQTMKGPKYGQSKVDVEVVSYDDKFGYTTLIYPRGKREESRRYRVSPNTGRLLSIDKYWRYL